MPYVVYAQAIVDTMLLHVAKQVVLQEIEADALFARRMLGGMARRLHALLGDVESYSLRSGTQRVIGFLLRGDCPAAPGADAAAGAQAAAGADASAGAHASAQTVTLPATKAMVASRLNLTPEHFSRILHELAAAGLIRVDGREITILDAGSLAAHME
jgi:CRP-like cAMP-binding protein